TVRAAATTSTITRTTRAASEISTPAMSSIPPLLANAFCMSTTTSAERVKSTSSTDGFVLRITWSSIVAMKKKLLAALFALLAAFAVFSTAQVQNYKPVTEEMLRNPSPDDWLSFSRTMDAQRFSPLKQINKQNVGKLGLAWARGLPPGTTEGIPIVHDGVMYLVVPGAIVQALDATNGDLI